MKWCDWCQDRPPEGYLEVVSLETGIAYRNSDDESTIEVCKMCGIRETGTRIPGYWDGPPEGDPGTLIFSYEGYVAQSGRASG